MYIPTTCHVQNPTQSMQLDTRFAMLPLARTVDVAKGSTIEYDDKAMYKSTVYGSSKESP